MKIKIILAAFVLIFLVLPLVSAVEPNYNFRKETQVDLKRPCINNGTWCSGSASCNLTITDPDNLLLINNNLMTNQISYHNYTLNETQTFKLGIFKVDMVCTDVGLNGAETFYYQISQTGTTPTTSQGILYVIIIIFASIFALLFLYFGVTLDGNDGRNIDNELIFINIFKYFKLLFILLSYLCIVWISWMLYQLSLAYFNIEIGTNVFKVIFYFLFWPLFPIIILIFAGTIYKMVIDISKWKLMGRGVTVR